MQLINGKETANQIKAEIADEVATWVKQGGKQPHLAAIIVGNDPASETYVRNKVKACEKAGLKSTEIKLPETVSENVLLHEIEKVNQSDSIDGLIVQLPLPEHISETRVIEAIHPAKDVDGFHPINVGRMIANLPAYLPATPAGIMELLKRYNIETSGKHCVVIGRSNIVGTPVSILMSRKSNPGNATVTLCHSRTQNMEAICRQADILIVAIGKPGFLKANMVKEGAVVIDVGTNRLRSDKTKSGWKLFGDVDFDQVAPQCSYITPVPGGVGPMTIVSLLRNTVLAAKKAIYK